MRLTKPRYAPLSDAELNEEQAEALKDFRPGPVRKSFSASCCSSFSSASLSGA